MLAQNSVVGWEMWGRRPKKKKKKKTQCLRSAARSSSDEEGADAGRAMTKHNCSSKSMTMMIWRRRVWRVSWRGSEATLSEGILSAATDEERILGNGRERSCRLKRLNGRNRREENACEARWPSGAETSGNEVRRGLKLGGRYEESYRQTLTTPGKASRHYCDTCCAVNLS